MALACLLLTLAVKATIHASPGPSSLGGLPVDAAGCRLLVGGTAIRPKQFGAGDPMSYDTNVGVLTVDPTGVRLLGKWRAESSHKDLKLLQIHKDVGYFGYENEDVWSQDKDTSINLLRLDLQSGRWLDPIYIASRSGTGRRLVGIAVNGDSIALLTVSADMQGGMLIKSPFMLDVLRLPNLRRLWWTEIQQPDVKMLSPWAWQRNRYTGRFAIDAVQWVNGNILVCLEAEGPIISFGQDAKVHWRLDRPWELVRGFEGPSMFEFNLRRTKQTSPFSDVSQAYNPTVDPNMTGTIVAGPTWVENKSNSGGDWFHQGKGSFVIAVAQAARKDISSSDCVLYEITEHGVPRTRTVMPQFVLGGGEHSVSGGAVFACSNGSAARFTCFTGAGEPGGMGPFPKPDSTGTLEWFVQKQQRWSYELLNTYPFSSAAETDAVVYSRTKMIRANEGWHCEKKVGSPVLFPIQVFDLKDGHRVDAALSVPLTVAIERPATNFTRTENRFSSLVSLYAGITRMEVIEGTLRIFLKDQDKGGYIDFPLPSDWR